MKKTNTMILVTKITREKLLVKKARERLKSIDKTIIDLLDKEKELKALKRSKQPTEDTGQDNKQKSLNGLRRLFN